MIGAGAGAEVNMGGIIGLFFVIKQRKYSSMHLVGVVLRTVGVGTSDETGLSRGDVGRMVFSSYHGI